MPSLTAAVSIETGLRERLTRFLSNASPWKKPLRDILRLINERKWEAVIFGGVLRDLAVFGPSERPRDVDIVVTADVSHTELENAFDKWTVRRTRVGGLHLLVDKWMFDIWNVADTWGINRLGLPANLSELPKTTFLNVEAIAAGIDTARGQQRQLYSYGFAEAIENRTVDINFMENPFPALAVVRSLLTAARLDFKIGPRLGKYILEKSHSGSFRELVEIQKDHYAMVRIPEPKLDLWIGSINAQLSNGASAIMLPLERGEQLEFCNFWYPSV